MADRHTTEKLLEGERLSGKVTLFAKVTILPGDELPYHEHHGETEVYHILSGEGIYQDNNKTYPVQKWFRLKRWMKGEIWQKLN